jgi:L-ornithine N5-oxygenase
MSLNTCVSPAIPTRSTTEDFQNAPVQSFDLLGIGFGPANLSLSVRLAEENLINPSSMLQSPAEDSNNRDGSNKQISMKSCFIESNDSFRWHPGMMVSLSPCTLLIIYQLRTLVYRPPLLSPFFSFPRNKFTSDILIYLHSHPPFHRFRSVSRRVLLTF